MKINLNVVYYYIHFIYFYIYLHKYLIIINYESFHLAG